MANLSNLQASYSMYVGGYPGLYCNFHIFQDKKVQKNRVIMDWSTCLNGNILMQQYKKIKSVTCQKSSHLMVLQFFAYNFYIKTGWVNKEHFNGDLLNMVIQQKTLADFNLDKEKMSDNNKNQSKTFRSENILFLRFLPRSNDCSVTFHQ